MTPSVYVIDETLSSLMLMREEEGLTDAERSAIDGQIEAWMAAEVAKVDRVRSYLQYSAVMRQAAGAEKDRQAARESQWAAREKRLKNIVQYVMEAQQRRRCEGNTGVLRLQGNGGKRAITITDETLVPDEYCMFTLVMRAEVRRLIDQLIRMAGKPYSLAEAGTLIRTVDHEAVRKALEKKCGCCEGGQVRCSDDESETMDCPDCHGTGGGTVPGARLEERGQHLRVE